MICDRLSHWPLQNASGPNSVLQTFALVTQGAMGNADTVKMRPNGTIVYFCVSSDSHSLESSLGTLEERENRVIIERLLAEKFESKNEMKLRREIGSRKTLDDLREWP